MESKQPYTGPKRPSESTFVFGIHPVNEALDAGKDIESVIVIRSSQNERLNKLLGRVRATGVPIKMVPREKLNALTLKNHQGIVAMLSPITYQPLEEIVLGAFERGEAPILIAADGITDVRNLGAIARSAECFGAHALIVPERGSAAINDGAIKSSSGALLRLPVCRVSNFSESRVSEAKWNHMYCSFRKECRGYQYQQTSGSFLSCIGRRRIWSVNRRNRTMRSPFENPYGWKHGKLKRICGCRNRTLCA